MLTQEYLQTLLSQTESDLVERTQATQDMDKFGQAICAFANDFPDHRRPGYLLLGVRDDGTLSGLKVTDALLTNMGGLRSDGNLLPPPALKISTFSLAGGDVLVVEVPPSDLPPVRYKGRIYIRVGPRKAIATEQEDRILTERRTARARTFDTSPCPEARLADLSLALFLKYRTMSIAPEALVAEQRPLEEQMASLRFYDLQRACPTYAGLLLLTHNPRRFLPGAYVQFLQFSGMDYTHPPYDQGEIEGEFHEMIYKLQGQISVFNRTRMTYISGFQESLQPDYPLHALRELALNALMHRDYMSHAPIRFYIFQDRIEIQSPGGLYGEATRDNFPHQNSYRNPVIAESLKSFGFVNRFGYGVQRAQALLAQNGSQPAKFTFDPNFVRVTIYKRSL